MKPLLLKVGESDLSSFDIRHERSPYFDNPWHYHPEFELALVLKSSGLRFIGDNIEPFTANDLVLLGANLPHYWRNEECHYQSQKKAAEAIILRFRLEAWGRGLLEAPEMRPIYELMKQAARGIHFSLETAEAVTPLLHDILSHQGPERLIGWLRVFTLLARAEGTRLLSGKSFGGQNPAQDSGRMQQVLGYLQENLGEEIRLDDIAELANMNKAAFCRYFKQQTNKTFTEVVNELRIQSACQRLLESSDDINLIAFRCGFRDISYFNQVFKARKGVSPSGFREGFR